MNADRELLEETAEELYENAPCGFLSTRPDGTIVRVNRTFEVLTGRDRGELLGRRFHELLAPADRIYHETHYAPLLRMQGSVREIALNIVRRDGSRMPALVNAVQLADETGRPRYVRLAIFGARDRRSYEKELLKAHRRADDVAKELQRGLLAGELPTSESFDVDVFYRPAVAGLDVGGDWYDAFWLDRRRVALVVGDVVGRGIGAAATMGQLRSAVRALASTGLGPAALLEALDRYASRHDTGRMTTLVYAELDLDTRRLRYASAGHPPGVLIPAGGSADFLAGGRSLPLDVGAGDVSREEAEIAVGPGARVVLYTDGLVERRNRPLTTGLANLLATIDAFGEDLSMARLARRLEDEAHPDDVCVLGVRVVA